jgi:hypothetical protein
LIELNATSVGTAANILSLINLLGDSSITPTSQWASFPQNFSALLTEMMGPAAGQYPGGTDVTPAQVANVTQTPVPSAAQPAQLATLSGPESVNKPDDSSAVTATDSTSSGLPLQPVQWAMASTKPNFGEREESIAAAVHDSAALADSTKDSRPQTVPTAAATLSNPLPLPREPQQDVVKQAITRPTTKTSLPWQLGQVANLVAAPEPKDLNLAGRKQLVVGMLNYGTFCVDSNEGTASQAAPAGKTTVSDPVSLPSGLQPPSVDQAVAADPTITVASEPSVENGADLEKSAVRTVSERTASSDSTRDAWPLAAPTIAELVQDHLGPKIASAKEPVQTAKGALSSVAESVQSPNLSPEPIPDAPVLNTVQTGETSKTRSPENSVSGNKAAPANNFDASLLHFPVSPLTFTPAVADDKTAKLDQPQVEPQQVFQRANPELERAFADVKSFELTVQPEAPPASAVPIGQPASNLQDQPSKAVIVTTDPVKNLTQQQLPPRIVPVLKVMPEAKAAGRSKPSATSEKDVIAALPATQISDLVRPVERADQVLAAHTIEIPNVPHLPVVRIVAMQVGEADSEVTIRIQQRDGNLTLQLNAENDRLHQNLQSSVGSLAQALNLENVPVSGIEVSRKSLTDRVRRMKETH